MSGMYYRMSYYSTGEATVKRAFNLIVRVAPMIAIAFVSMPELQQVFTAYWG